MRKFRLTKGAASDIRAIGSYYREHGSPKADEFKDRLRDLEAYLVRFAHLYPEYKYGLRKAKIASFKYCVYYAVTPAEVAVVAVLADADDPEKKKRLLQRRKR